MSGTSEIKERRGNKNRWSRRLFSASMCLIMLGFLVWTILSGGEDDTTPGATEWHVFLVGTNGYTEGVPNLKFAERDVDQLHKFFKELGVKEENMIVLKTENSDIYKTTTESSIKKNYDKFLNGLTKNSIAFVFLSGHGFSEGKRSYYAPRDFVPDDKDAYKVPIDDMMKRLSKSRACFKWLCVDACRDELPSRSLTSNVLTIVNVPRGVVLTQSCKQGQLSYEAKATKGIDAPEDPVARNDEDGNGIFTRVLLDAINRESPKADVDMDGVVTMGEIRTYLQDRIPKEASAIYHCKQEPTFTVGKGATLAEIDSRVLFKDPRVPGWKLYSEAKRLIGQGEFEDAIEALKKAKKYLPDAPEIDELYNVVMVKKEAGKLYSEGKRLSDQGTFREALELLEKAKEILPDDPDVDKLLGTVRSKIDGRPHEIREKTMNIVGIPIKFIWIEPGKFTMGSPEKELYRSGNEAQRDVEITTGFWLAETETTQELWRAVMGSNPSKNQNADIANLPVENVSWNECQDFLRKLNELSLNGVSFSLPTEEHWEYACRAGSPAAYCWGDEPKQGEGRINGYDLSGRKEFGKGWMAFPFDDGNAGSASVGTFVANDWGLKDMHGNVSEWCADVSEDDESKRIIRGGDFQNAVRMCRSACRESRSTDFRGGYLGFRLEMTEPAMSERTVNIAGLPVKFRWIAPGRFMMGSPEDEVGRDAVEKQHEVEITTGFWLAELETNQELWNTVMGEKPSENQNEDSNNLPVVNVSWEDCQRFFERINKLAPAGVIFSLPTEEHWEYACRAGTVTPYWWGKTPEGGKGNANFYDEACDMNSEYKGRWEVFFNDGYVETSPCGVFAANAWGLKDMIGNVWEWCEDVAGSELCPPGEEFTTSNHTIHVIRGGSWLAHSRLCRSAYRSGYPADTRKNYLGFRIEMREETPIQ